MRPGQPDLTNNALTPTSFSFPGGASRTLVQATIEQPTKSTTETVNKATLERWIGLDSLGRITRHLKSAAKIGWWFTYDSLGQLRTARTRSKNPDGEPGGCPNADYGMHTTTCTPAANYTTLDSLLFTYDAVGNRTDKGGTYTTGNRITNFDNCSYKTDAEGNVVRRYGGACAAPIDTLLWTKEGQLDSLKIGTTGVKFLYDAFGRLSVKRVNGSVQAYFLWDGDNLLAQLTSAGTAVVVEYSYYPGMDNPHAIIKQPAGTRFYVRPDGLGSVLALTNESNQIRRTYQYDYWGKSTGGTDTEGFSDTDRARWKGALWLGPEADVYYMRNRWYEAGTGRFLSEDPIGLAGGSNPAVYADNDPINRTDPSGLTCEWISAGTVYRVTMREITVTSVGFWFCIDIDTGVGDLFRPSNRGSGGGRPGAPRPPRCLSDRCEALTSVDPLSYLLQPEVRAGRFVFAAALPALTPAALRRLIQSILKDREEWVAVASFSEGFSRRARRGVNVQTVWENSDGSQLIEHSVFGRGGQLIHQSHYRGQYKPTGSDIP